MSSNGGNGRKPNLVELIERTDSDRQEEIAEKIGIDPSAGAADIAARLRDHDHLRELVTELVEPALLTLAASVLMPTGGVAEPIESNPHSSERHQQIIATLERRGLIYPHGIGYYSTHIVPRELAPALGRICARHLADPIEPLEDSEVTATAVYPEGVLHDAAGIAAALAIEPARLKQTGQLYAKEEPRLAAMLPEPSPGFSPDLIELLEEDRRALAMAYLTKRGAIEIRQQAAEEGPPHRELTATGRIAEALEPDPGDFQASIDFLAGGPGEGLIRAFASPLDRAWLSLDDIDAATNQTLSEFPLGFGPDHDEGPEWLLPGLVKLWLFGEVELGLDAEGEPIAMRFRDTAQTGAHDEAPESEAGPPLGICQADFDIVLLRRPDPAERFTLLLCAEPQPGQAHVLKLTQERAQAAASFLDEGVPEALRRLLGDLPQNVDRTLTSWVDNAPAPPAQV